MTKHVVPSGVRAMALARYLARAYPLLPGHALRGLLKRRDVRVNGARADKDSAVSGGDEVAVYLPDGLLTGPLDVIGVDGDFLAVDKPAGLPVDVDADGVGQDTLLARAKRAYPAAELCHRLDAGTGGVALMALSDEAHERALNAFRVHEVEKQYLCVVRGRPTPDEGELTHYLVKDAQNAQVRVCDAFRPGAQAAKLKYAVLREAGGSALVRVELMTGRTHQIRVQLAHIGHPLIGDDKYGDRALNRARKRAQPMLWCCKLALLGRAYTSTPPWSEDEYGH